MSARHYIQRQARYVFQTGDSTLVRFAAMETKGITSRAVIRDLSESGVSFTLPLDETDLPDEGAPLKIEFPIPGRDKIACFATVTRVEQRSEWVPEWGDRGYHLIALKFRHLPTLHLRAIQQGLNGRVDEEQTFHEIKRAHAFAFAAISVALVICMIGLVNLR